MQELEQYWWDITGLAEVIFGQSLGRQQWTKVTGSGTVGSEGLENGVVEKWREVSSPVLPFPSGCHHCPSLRSDSTQRQ